MSGSPPDTVDTIGTLDAPGAVARPSGRDRPDRVRWSWSSTLLRTGMAALAMRWLASRLLPAAAQPAASAAAWGILALAVALRWLAGLPDGAARARRATAAGRPVPTRLALLLVPAELAGLLRLAVVTAGGCLAWIARRPAPPRPEGRRLEDRRKGFYDTFFAMNILSFITEIPVMTLILTSSVPERALHVAVHALEAAAVVGLFGDRWLVRAGGHVLTPTHLDLRAGARAAARVPLAAIAAIEPIGRMRPEAWCRAHGVHRADTGTVSVLDRPNLVLTLHPGAPGTWSRLQVEWPLPRHLFVYLDDPAALAPAVEAAIAAGGAPTTAAS